jgi:hypothetical protein
MEFIRFACSYRWLISFLLAGLSGAELAGAESANGAPVLEDLAYCEEEEIGI